MKLAGTGKRTGRENARRKTPGEELWLEGPTWLLVNSPGHSQPAQSGHSSPTKVS